MQTNNYHEHYSRLVIHTPHAGTLLPLNTQGHPMGTWLRRKAVHPLFCLLTDHYTDKLFAAEVPYIKQITFPYSRLFCDVERLIDDPLEEKGMGICYNIGQLIHGKPNSMSFLWSMTKEQAYEMYHVHHTALSLAVKGKTIFDRSLILDCHSFTERDNVLNPDAHKFKDIDICLGFNEDDSKPKDDTIENVAKFFRRCGYIVELNRPFSNAICAGKSNSLMIEVNKHCYMNEDTLAVTAGYYKLHSELQQLYHLLLNSII